MTSLLEKIVAIIAPHHCISCSIEDNIWCDACRLTEHMPLLPSCLVCGSPSADWRVCPLCFPSSGIRCIWAAGEYSGTLAKIVQLYKFERVGEAYKTLGAMMLDVLPFDGWTVVPVPTAPRRVRERGYDQTALLARHITRMRQLRLSPALLRVQDVRQVGKNRMQRQEQSAKMFSMARSHDLQGAKVLLVDDVCTTGSTLSAAASVLRAAGASRVDAVIAAWQPPKDTFAGSIR